MKRFVWLIPVLALALVVVVSGALGDASASLASAPEALGIGASEEANAATTSGEVLAAIEERQEKIAEGLAAGVAGEFSDLLSVLAGRQDGNLDALSVDGFFRWLGA